MDILLGIVFIALAIAGVSFELIIKGRPLLGTLSKAASESQFLNDPPTKLIRSEPT